MMFTSLITVWEMVSVLVCILPSLVSVESKSWRQSLALLAPYLTHPLGLPDIRNSVYSTLRLHTRQAHQEHLTLWGKDNQHLLSPAAHSPFSVASVNPFDVSRWIFVQMCFYQLMCFSHLLCLARAALELCVPILPAEIWVKLPDGRHVTQGKQ